MGQEVSPFIPYNARVSRNERHYHLLWNFPVELVDSSADDGNLRNLFQIMDHLLRVSAKVAGHRGFIGVLSLCPY